jgi:hypothetical protein
MYEPRVIGARVGQKVEIVNSDPIFHNVRSVTKVNENFNFGMATQKERITKVFLQPEIVVQTKCDVHPWMNGYIAVVDHPYFDVTKDNGQFRIVNLPAGQYTLQSWHETLGTQEQDFSVEANQELELNFTYKDRK